MLTFAEDDPNQDYGEYTAPHNGGSRSMLGGPSHLVYIISSLSDRTLAAGYGTALEEENQRNDIERHRLMLNCSSSGLLSSCFCHVPGEAGD